MRTKLALCECYTAILLLIVPFPRDISIYGTHTYARSMLMAWASAGGKGGTCPPGSGSSFLPLPGKKFQRTLRVTARSSSVHEPSILSVLLRSHISLTASRQCSSTFSCMSSVVFPTFPVWCCSSVSSAVSWCS